MSNKYKEIPHFDNEDEEIEFWAIHDSTDYIDWDKAEKNPVFPRLKRTSQTASENKPD